ncbi:helix-turn-helix transcriptional regulator [Candidatus Binatus sp.]|uniref:helix-turn-helix transcriptional regulator n=1 Tax=Candidatus Binatus sp. TaxID=2811406 RepID=UPI003C7596C0
MPKEASPLPLDDVIMSESDCARMIGVAPETAKRMRRHGEGPPFFAVSGHVVRYSRTRVLAWLAEREVTGAEVKQIEESKESKP